VALDAYCGEQFVQRVTPGGFVVVFGSASLNSGPIYDLVRSFAKSWIGQHPDLPIMTGGGPGLMLAANQGVADVVDTDASGRPTSGSYAFDSYFVGPGDTVNAYVADSYMFSDYATRERALLAYAKAVVVTPGGYGTAWELFMSLSQIKEGKLDKHVPLVILGQEFGDAVRPLVSWMLDNHTIGAGQELDPPADPNNPLHFHVAATADDAVAFLAGSLGLDR
jgi:predicted Rossmann-fold nucleotide-binding protein